MPKGKGYPGKKYGVGKPKPKPKSKPKSRRGKY